MIEWAMGVAALWVITGWGLLWWGARTRGNGFRRALSTRVCTPGQTIRVSLSLEPPTDPAPAEPLDLILLLDRSASMGAAPGSPLRTMLRSASNFIKQLPCDSHVAVIAFDDKPVVHCGLGTERIQALDALASVSPGGGTSIAAALACAGKVLSGGRPGVPKVLLLCSDGQDSIEHVRTEALALRSAAPVRILCIGFGDEVVDEVFLAATENPADYFRVRRTRDMTTLFQKLVTEVSGRRGVLAVVTEEVAGPRPFSLHGDSDPHAAVSDLRLIWSLTPVDGAASASYTVEPHCIGWLKVVAHGAAANWVMPDGGSHPVAGPAAPRVLVLPRGFAWTWPILNPLAMLLLGRLWQCRNPATALRPQQREMPALRPELPSMPPAPAEQPWTLAALPTLVVGMGTSGGDILSALKFKFSDRQIPADKVGLLQIALGTPPALRMDGPLPRLPLAADEAVILDADLAPILRAKPQSHPHSWIRRSRWLAETKPATCAHGIDDRGKARLALLTNPERVEAVLADAIEHLGGHGQVILVGRADDPEASGLLGEIAHICAGHRMPVTAVLAAPGTDSRWRAGLEGLAQELERLLALRGDPVFSDRSGGRWATHLFDRCVIVGSGLDTDGERVGKLVETVFSLAVDEHLRTTLAPLAEAAVHRLDVSAVSLPQDVLWRWAKARCLRETLVEQILQLHSAEDCLKARSPDDARVVAAIERFWTFDGSTAAMPLSLTIARQLQRSSAAPVGSGTTVPAAADLSAYHQLEEFCDGERSNFTGHLERWAQAELSRPSAGSGPAMAILARAVTALQTQLDAVRGQLSRLGTYDTDIGTLLTAELVVEFSCALRNLGENLQSWRTGLHALAVQVVEAEAENHHLLGAFDLPWPAIEQAYRDWATRLRDPLSSQFALIIRPASAGGGTGLRLHGSDDDNVTRALAGLNDRLDAYRSEVARWPTPEWFAGRLTPGLGRWIATGRFASRFIQSADVQQSESAADPFRISAFQIESGPIRIALDLRTGQSPAAEFVWPEDANAQRIADRIRNQLDREPPRFTPEAVNLLRSPAMIVQVAQEAAAGRITLNGDRLCVERGGTILLAPAEGPASFTDLLRQMLAARTTDGRPIPPAPDPGLPALPPQELARQAIKGLPVSLGRHEDMWRDVICGAALECAG